MVYESLMEAAMEAKFKKYDKILPSVEKIKREYEQFPNKKDAEILEEALLLEQKAKEGKESVDRYIVERERESLIEIGLERLLKKK